MRRTILTVLGSALLAASVAQAAAAAEHHDSRKAHRVPVTTSERFRNSNAYVVEPDWSRYENGYSAPAGH
jgi:hypothetical protein